LTLALVVETKTAPLAAGLHSSSRSTGQRWTLQPVMHAEVGKGEVHHDDDDTDAAVYQPKSV
jgi:hypothetical protein